MKSFTILSFLASAASTTAQNFTSWEAAGANDVRSPCPALNTLANHGFLPHSGKGISLPQLITALNDGMNVGADFAVAAGALSLFAVQDDPLALSFNLDDLNEHNFPVEHDASLSRADYYEGGDDHSFNQTIFDTVLAYYEGNSTTIAETAKAKYNRVKTESARDKKFEYNARQVVLSYGEASLFISVIGDPITGVAPIEWVKTFFEQERLPYAEGWRRGDVETNLPSLVTMIGQMVLESGETLPEGLEITKSSLSLALGGYDPITGILAHVL